MYVVQSSLDWSDPVLVQRQRKIRRTVKKKLNERWRGFKANLKKMVLPI